MEKAVSLSAKLPPFKMNLEELAFFLKRLTSEFGAEPKLSITISMKDTAYKFDSVEEVHNCPDPLLNIKEFRIRLADYSVSRTLRLYVDNNKFLSSAEIIADSPSEAWCSGIIGAALRFIKPYKRWYSFIRKVPSRIVFIALNFLPYLLHSINLKIPSYLIALGVMVWFVCGLDFFAAFYFFPTAVLNIEQKQSFFQRHKDSLTGAF